MNYQLENRQCCDSCGRKSVLVEFQGELVVGRDGGRESEIGRGEAERKKGMREGDRRVRDRKARGDEGEGERRDEGEGERG